MTRCAVQQIVNYRNKQHSLGIIFSAAFAFNHFAVINFCQMQNFRSSMQAKHPMQA